MLYLIGKEYSKFLWVLDNFIFFGFIFLVCIYGVIINLIDKVMFLIVFKIYVIRL